MIYRARCVYTAEVATQIIVVLDHVLLTYRWRAIIDGMPIQQINYGRVTWINIINATTDDVDELQHMYSYIHPLHLEDVRSSMERPRIDEDEDYLFIVMHFPLWDARLRLSRASEVDMIVGRGYVVTIHDGRLKPLLKLFEDCERDEDARMQLLGKGANHTFYTIIDRLVDYIFPILRRVDANIHDIEENIFTANTRRIIQDIAVVRRDIIALRRIIRHQVPIVEELENGDNPIIHEDLEEYFSDIDDHLRKARDIIEEDYEIVVSLAETADTLASHRINEVMRILTVFSVILLPLTLISSIYGMNIANMPFADHENGFIIVTVFMIAITIFMLVYFRRRNWL